MRRAGSSEEEFESAVGAKCRTSVRVRFRIRDRAVIAVVVVFGTREDGGTYSITLYL